jgi:hypothetical protein
MVSQRKFLKTGFVGIHQLLKIVGIQQLLNIQELIISLFIKEIRKVALSLALCYAL